MHYKYTNKALLLYENHNAQSYEADIHKFTANVRDKDYRNYQNT